MVRDKISWTSLPLIIELDSTWFNINYLLPYLCTVSITQIKSYQIWVKIFHGVKAVNDVCQHLLCYLSIPLLFQLAVTSSDCILKLASLKLEAATWQCKSTDTDIKFRSKRSYPEKVNRHNSAIPGVPNNIKRKGAFRYDSSSSTYPSHWRHLHLSP